MNSEQDLINKLMVSKKIMDKHNLIGRGNTTQTNTLTSPEVEEYQPTNVRYNLPEEFTINESKNLTHQQQLPTADKIMNSKLPDEIKRLMLEHPIEQPTSMNGSATLSNELVEKASRLMNTNIKNEKLTENVNKTNQTKQLFDLNELKNVIKETVEDVLKENGLLVESSSRSNEMFKFRVGQHILCSQYF